MFYLRRDLAFLPTDVKKRNLHKSRTDRSENIYVYKLSNSFSKAFLYTLSIWRARDALLVFLLIRQTSGSNNPKTDIT